MPGVEHRDPGPRRESTRLRWTTAGSRSRTDARGRGRHRTGIYGGGGPDRIQGGLHAIRPELPLLKLLDVVLGGAGKDEIHGGNVNPASSCAGDILHGGPTTTRRRRGGGKDSVYGDGGDDLVGGGPGADKIFGSDGTDIADYSNANEPVIASLDGNTNDGQKARRTRSSPTSRASSADPGRLARTATTSEHPQRRRRHDAISARRRDILAGQGGRRPLRPGLGLDDIYGGSDPGQAPTPPDTVTYDERTNPLNVSLDGLADDGEAGETT